MKIFEKMNPQRVLLNLLFIGLIIFAAVENNTKKIPVIFIVGYNILLFIPAWINNFALLPKLRFTKKVKHYLFAVAILFFGVVLTLGTYLNWLYNKFNTTDLIDISPFGIISSAPQSLEKYQVYFDVFPGILIVIFVMVVGYSMQEFLLKIKNEKQIQTQQNIAELSLLKSQISPHFLFNVLNNLYALSLKASQKTPEVILNLSDILRYSLYDSHEKEISITNEIHILNTYIEIERLRIPANANISFNYEDVQESVKIAPMLLLPLIENAFKHGTDSTINGSYIIASLNCNANRLIFKCENNFKESGARVIGGIGIENIRKRLQLLYPSKHKIAVEKKDNVYSVTLEIKF